MKFKSFLPFLCAITAYSISAATAAITLDDSITFTTSPTNAINGGVTVTINTTTLTGFDPSGSDKLVLTVSAEGNATGRFFNTVSFNGQSMTQAAFGADTGTSTGQQITAIYFLDASVALGDLVVTFSGAVNGIGGSLLALSGTQSGVSSVIGGSGSTVNLTTTVANSFVVATHANNNSGASAQTPLTPLFNGFIGSGGGGSGYATIATAGAGTYSFTGGTTRPATAAAVFAPIPEPGAALLGSLGMLALLRRRRT